MKIKWNDSLIKPFTNDWNETTKLFSSSDGKKVIKGTPFTLFNSDDGGLFSSIVSLLRFRTKSGNGSVKSIVRRGSEDRRDSVGEAARRGCRREPEAAQSL